MVKIKRWVSQSDLAKELSSENQVVSIQTVHNWVQRGKVKWKFAEGTKVKLIDRKSLKQ